MEPHEIVQRIVEYLDQHLRGLRGAIGQEPYRSQFFQLFEEARARGYAATSSHPRLTADGLRDEVIKQWITHGDPKQAEKLKWLDDLCDKWHEWVYAWDKRDRWAQGDAE